MITLVQETERDGGNNNLRSNEHIYFTFSVDILYVSKI